MELYQDTHPKNVSSATSPDGPYWPPVEGASESRPTAARCAESTGSLPAWWRELFPLIEKWEEKAKGYANDAKYHEYRGSSELRREYNALWSAHKSCAEELRRQMAAAIKRQPEENNRISVTEK